MLSPDVVRRFAAVVGADGCIHEAERLRVYEHDALTAHRGVAELVVLPRSTAEVVAVVRLCREAGLAIVPRGSGTGLSGGATPVHGGVVVALTRMRAILEVNLDDGWIRVEPGVINLDITRRLAPHGRYYAPDPSSQQVCTIGGNVAENSGGAHCLKYGFTTNHVLGATVVLADGETVTVGGPCADPPGYDLRGVLVGSEGMLGLVVEVWLRILRLPQETRTLLAIFPTAEQAGAAVSAIIAAGIVPAAIEMMDRLAIVAIRAAVGVDWPDAGAALLVDVDGTAAEVAHTAAEAERLARAAGATELRLPRDAAERDTMWRGRKSAFAAVGRISPCYVVQDGVIPRGEIARVLGEIARLAAAAGLRVANVFHAGDGNLHPLVLYEPGQEDAAERVASAILKLCVSAGGSITGEHGVGIDKAAYMAEMFSDADLATMNLVRCAFDPSRAMNPGKVFPTPRLCGDRAGVYAPHPTETAGLAGRG